MNTKKPSSKYTQVVDVPAGRYSMEDLRALFKRQHRMDRIKARLNAVLEKNSVYLNIAEGRIAIEIRQRVTDEFLSHFIHD